MADTIPTPAPTGNQTDPFIAALQSKLMSTADMISSNNTGMEDKINKAISGVQTAGAASASGIKADYTAQEAQAAKVGETTMTSTSEASRGYAVNSGLIKNIQDTTTKNINDLEVKKQQALSIGDAATASKVADLQMQGLTFQQNATQQAFSNLLSTAGFMLQKQSADQAAKNQTFQESQAMSQISLQYGIKLNPGDTLDTVVNRAMPFASQAQKLSLQKAAADLRNTNAQTQKLLADAASTTAKFSSTEIDTIASAYLQKGDAVLGVIKNPDMLGKVITRATDIQNTQFMDNATMDKSSGVDKASAVRAVADNPNMDAGKKAAALKAIETVYGKTETPTNKPTTLKDITDTIAKGTLGGSTGVLEFLTGVKGNLQYNK